MKQAQLSNFFKAFTLVPETSNGDGQVDPGAAVGTRAQPPLQKQPAQTRPSSKRDHRTYEETKRIRVFQESWSGTYNWVRHDKKANVMYCEPCREFVHLHPARAVALIKGMFLY